MVEKAPVLFVIFNRPDITNRTFEEIRKYRPEKLYIAADGPRLEREGEAELCIQTRNLVLNGVDWPCEVKTRFGKENAGCGRGVYEAITWFFEHEEYGVILEDDCTPCKDFFPFCLEMLIRYRNDERIAQVSTFNVNCSGKESNSYFFTSYPSIWGWATWRRAWKNIDFQMENWEYERRKIFRRFGLLEGLIHYLLWRKIFRKIRSGGKPFSWGMQWSLYIFLHDKWCITSSTNLIENRGVGNGTNCSDANNLLGKVRYGKLHFPLKHPELVALDQAYEKQRSRSYVYYYACYLPVRKIKKYFCIR